MNKDFITFEHITKSFDGETVLDDLCLNIKENEFMTLLGPSGCGKTTTLRLLGGFETPDSGKIFLTARTLPPLHPMSES